MAQIVDAKGVRTLKAKKILSRMLRMKYSLETLRPLTPRLLRRLKQELTNNTVMGANARNHNAAKTTASVFN